MATKRKPIHTNSGSRLNFRPSDSSGSKFNFRPPENVTSETKGTKPLPEPSSVLNVLLIMVLHVCRKTIFIDTSIKVAIYGGSLFLVSLIVDILPFPKSYFSSSNNLFNLYFVKLGWGWTLLLSFPFITLTSFTYCCGKRELVMKHLTRLAVATFFWFFWVRIFSYIEANYGKCSVKSKSVNSKQTCFDVGGVWYGFDISGHAYILIYSSLVLIEEARAINGWEGIKDLIRNEDYARTRPTNSASASEGPLRILTNQEFLSLKDSYEKFTPFIRLLFISMTLLCILWDVMLITTILYYHIMIEKFISGAIAILMWFATYRYWYVTISNLPGDGLFKYKDVKQTKSLPLHKRASNNSKNDIPKFMGMPLYAARHKESKDDDNDTTEADNPSTSKLVI